MSIIKQYNAFPDDPMQRMNEESPKDHELFLQYCELGGNRSFNTLAAIKGVKHSVIVKLANKFYWTGRAKKFDEMIRELEIKEVQVDETVASKAQYMAGFMLLRMGLGGLHAKNPNLLSVDQSMKVLKEGALMMNVAASIDSDDSSMDMKTKIDSMLDAFIGGGGKPDES